MLRSLRDRVCAAAFLLLPIVAACESTASAGEEGATVPAARAAPQVVVDSGLPMPELIERFQASSGGRPDTLGGGATAVGDLVQRYVSALAEADTAMIRDLSVSRAEYAYLVFPGSLLARPPYELNPEVAWLMQSLESEKGVRRALSYVRGGRASFAGVACPAAIANGDHRIWRSCSVDLRQPGGSRTQVSLFAEILEVGGRYKFLSYANPLPRAATPP